MTEGGCSTSSTGPFPLAGSADQGLTYAQAGVDVAAGEAAVERIKEQVASTKIPGVLGGIGGFAGMFSLAESGQWDNPVLLSSTDGVGTKMAIAIESGKYDTIGIDLVAMCVDDLACAGGRPLFLLDYIVMDHLDQEIVESIVSGIAWACRKVGAALLGGEMAEHPGAMARGELDVAGFAVGVAEAAKLWGPARVRPGDVLVGLPSPGLRSNGYSLARRALLEVAGRSLDEPAWIGASRTLGQELLEPSVLYSPGLVELGIQIDVHAAAHITGGGIASNLKRALPETCGAVIELGTWPVPEIFAEVQRCGLISLSEMSSVFNLGLGMIVIVDPQDADQAVATLEEFGARKIGSVQDETRDVSFQGRWPGNLAS